MLLPGLYRKLIDVDVKELYAAVSGADKDLVLVGLGPGGVVERILGVKAV